MKEIDSFHEMENTVLGFCDEEVVFCDYEGEDYVSDYNMIDEIGSISVTLPEKLIDFYRDAVDLDRKGKRLG